MKKKFWEWFAFNVSPKECLYFCTIKTYAKATTEKYTSLTPDEVTWSMAVKHLGVE